MERYNMTVKKFADHFLPSNAKIKVMKSSETIFASNHLHYMIFHNSNDIVMILFQFVPSNAKIKVMKSSETIFDGTLDELYYYGANALDLVVDHRLYQNFSVALEAY